MVAAYLNLQERLSQLWFNQYTLLLVIMAVKLHIFSNQLIKSLESTETYVKLSCSTLSKYASSISSVPSYLSEMANTLITDAMNSAITGFIEGLKLTITGVENMVLFTIDLVVGTYACVLTATIDGAVEVAVNVTESVVDAVNTTVITLANMIQDGLEDLDNVVDDVISAADKVETLFTGDDKGDVSSKFKNINTTIAKLRDWKIDDSINDKLNNLAKSVPDFEDVKNYTESLISDPFESIILKLDNSSLQRLVLVSDFTQIPLNKTTEDACSIQKVETFFKSINHKISSTTKILLIVLVITALLVIVPLAYAEYRNWKRLVRIADDPNISDTKEKILIYENRVSQTLGKWISSSFPDSKAHKVRWIIAYATTRSSLVLALIGFSGLIVVLFQCIILKAISESYLSQELSNLATDLDLYLSSNVADWVKDTNDVIDSKQEELNDELFGWIDESCTAVNNTLEEFLEKMNDAVDEVFQNTPLYNYVKDIVACVLGDKIESVQEGITWVYDHSEINFPKVNSTLITDVISGSSNASNSVGIAGNMDKTLNDAADAVIDEFKESIRLELYISIILISIWTLQIVIGLLIRQLEFWIANGQRFTSSENEKLSFEKKVFEISHPIAMTQSELFKYSNHEGIKKVSDPLNRVTSGAVRSYAGDVDLGIIDDTLNDLIYEDNLIYGRTRQSNATSSYDDLESGISEILTLQDVQFKESSEVTFKKWAF